jgi:hypothetical protein
MVMGVAGAGMSFQFSLYDALVGIDVPVEKARAVIDALERDMGATLATKTDIQLLKREIEGATLATKTDIQLLRQEIEGARLAAKLKIDHLRKDVERDMELMRASMTVRLGSIHVVTAGLLFAALKMT